MNKPKPEVIIVKETLTVSLLRDAFSFVVLFGLMSLGVLLESAAMQWIGGIVAFLWMLSKPTVNRMTYDIPGARKRLDELEAE